MLQTYDMKRFGLSLRSIRKDQGMTQKYVCNQLGINIDTIRKIENGFVIPKIETLTMLSTLYKTNLLTVLQNCFIDTTFTKYYEVLDKITISHDRTEVESAVNALSEYLDHQPMSHFITPHEAKMLKLITRLMLDFLSGKHQSVLDELNDVLGPSFKLLKHTGLNGLYFSELELRLIIVMSGCHMELDQFEEAIPLYEMVISFLLVQTDMRPYAPLLVLKCYYNLSYAYHLTDKHDLALKIAEKGIEYAVNHKILYVLNMLYARKAVAEWMLGLPEHLDSFQKSKHLIEICSNNRDSELFKKITYEKYGVSL